VLLIDEAGVLQSTAVSAHSMSPKGVYSTPRSRGPQPKRHVDMISPEDPHSLVYQLSGIALRPLLISEAFLSNPAPGREVLGKISVDATIPEKVSPFHSLQNWIKVFACGLRLRILISTNSLPRTIRHYIDQLPSILSLRGIISLQGKVVGILSAGFHPNDFLIGGTVRTIVGPILSVVIP
jgi:hypothetical protein